MYSLFSKLEQGGLEIDIMETYLVIGTDNREKEKNVVKLFAV